MNPLKPFFAVLALMAFAPSALAQSYTVGDITIANPVARATLPGQKVGGGYAVVANTGSSDDKLTGASADFAGMVHVHEMKMVDDVMRMNALPGGLPVPAGQTIKLTPGGYHLMFMQLKEPLKKGETRKVMLTFKKAGAVEVTFTVKSIAETMELSKDHMKMDFSGEKPEEDEKSE